MHEPRNPREIATGLQVKRRRRNRRVISRLTGRTYRANKFARRKASGARSCWRGPGPLLFLSNGRLVFRKPTSQRSVSPHTNAHCMRNCIPVVDGILLFRLMETCSSLLATGDHETIVSRRFYHATFSFC
jgi:hypothetical protein